MADVEAGIDLEHLRDRDKRDSTLGDKNSPKDSGSNGDGCDPPPGPPTCKHRPHRRLLHRFCLVKQIPDPTAYRRRLKWAITVLVAAAAAIDSTSTNIFYTALRELPGDFSISPTVANLTVALPIISTAIFPLYWSYASEQLGRREIYIVALIACITFNVLCASSSSIAMLIVMRILASGAGCAVTPLGAAVVAELWDVAEKGRAMSVYYIGVLMGPTLGPVLGGLLVQRWHWRATHWFLAAYGGLIFVLILMFLPDTMQDRPGSQPASKNKCSKQQRSFGKNMVLLGSILAFAVMRPLRIVFFLRSPAITIPIYLASITFLAVKAVQISIQQSFASAPYHFSPLITGLLFLPFSIGLIVGNLTGGKWSDHVMHRTAAACHRQDDPGAVLCAPEDRIKENALAAILLFPAALLWYGWSIEQGTMWVVPTFGLFFIGFSAGLLFSLVATVVVEMLPQRSASVMALNSLGQNIFATIGSAIAQPFLAAVGNGWVFTTLAALTLTSSLVVALMKRYGRRWREALVRTYVS